ncbi:MAG: hypothetical protein ACFHVJ_20110 [Aestuariibacter sp.]
MAIVVSDQFMFVNAWDEETYLTLQMADQVRVKPGYYLINLNYFLIRLGVSGSVQNLIFDVATPIILAAGLTFILVKHGLGKLQSLALIPTVLFCSLLFNYGNPLIKDWFGLPRTYKTVVSGWEGYVSLLRTPEPQLSYLLICLSILLYSRYRRYWLLLLPIPLVYFHVMVGYVAVLCCVFLYHILRNKFHRRFSQQAWLVAPAITFLLGSVAAWILFQIVGGQTAQTMSSKLVVGHQLYVPIHGIFVCLLALIWGGILGFKRAFLCQYYVLAIQLILLMFFVVNFQVISGFTLSPKNYFDYVLPVMSGITLLLLGISLFENGNASTLAMLSAIFSFGLLVLVFQSIGCSLQKRQCIVHIGHQLSTAHHEEVVGNPLGAISPVRGVTAKLAYGEAGMLIPPLSYQYSFLSYDPELVALSVAAAKLHYGEDSNSFKMIQKTYERLKHNKTYLLGRKEIDLLSLKKPGFVFIEPIAGPLYILNF